MTNFLDIIKQIVSDKLPLWTVIYDSYNMTNVTLDYLQGRGYKALNTTSMEAILTNTSQLILLGESNPLFIIVKDIETGQIGYLPSGIPYIQFNLEVSFCTFVEFEQNAEVRLKLQNLIIENALTVFLEELSAKLLVNNPNKTLTFPYQQFDSNEVQVRVIIPMTIPIC